ncbi:MAG: chemotaxis protein CheA [Roseovarius sp.]
MSNGPTDTFLQETVDGLDLIEERLLSLEDGAAPGVIDDLFRTLHTIKGSGAMFGFDALARFTHYFENAFELVRDGRLPLDRRLIDISLAARDHMAALLEANSEPARLATLEAAPEAQALVARLGALVEDAGLAAGGGQEAAGTGSAQNAANGAPKGPVRRFRIVYTPAEDSLRHGARPDLLMAELAELGEAEIVIDLTAVPPLDEIDPQASYLSWHVTLETAAGLEAVREVFVFADDIEISIASAPEPAAPTGDTGGADPAVALAETAGSATDAVGGRGALTEPGGTENAGRDAGGKPTSATNASVRVPAARLDDLMDQLGELVIAQTRLDSLAAEAREPALAAIAEEIDRLVTGLRDSTLAMRMLPIEVVFGKFRRVVRSLADELGKDVALMTTGGDTELDKNVIDSLTEPLVHMIRNSMDHGIETAEARRAAGKPEKATIGLSARQSGGEVLITVADDGRGLDEDAILARALDRGLLTPETAAALPREELHKLIFEPAFSTAATISSVSGRGVGMDAVRKAVTDLRGTIEIATRKGAGSAITLRLPVTLAIIDGLLVQVGEGVFVLPLSSVNECVELAEAECSRQSGRTLLRIRDEMVPFIKLDERLGLRSDGRAPLRVVIVSAEGRRIGLVVDDILGQHQTVIKTFSLFHRDVPGFAGSTILGDGRVALIIDATALVRSVQSADPHAATAA